MAPGINLDVDAFLKELERLVREPKQANEDLFTAAVRNVTGLQDLALSTEQRDQLKTIAYGVMYGSSPCYLAELINQGRYSQKYLH